MAEGTTIKKERIPAFSKNSEFCHDQAGPGICPVVSTIAAVPVTPSQRSPLQIYLSLAGVKEQVGGGRTIDDLKP
jgi:hypothetical protein